jgi:hypothetical protein
VLVSCWSRTRDLDRHPCPGPRCPLITPTDHMTRPSVQPVFVHLLGLGLNTIHMSISTLRGSDGALAWGEFPTAAQFCALPLAQPGVFPIYLFTVLYKSTSSVVGLRDVCLCITWSPYSPLGLVTSPTFAGLPTHPGRYPTTRLSQSVSITHRARTVLGLGTPVSGSWVLLTTRRT